jgi:phosphoserine phosphatase RsbU/P
MQTGTHETGELLVSGPGTDERIPLNPKGMLIGRSAECQVVLESTRVSRQHAMLYKDPFGRWVVQDLASRRGVQVGGQTVKSCPVQPGEKIVIGPYTLAIHEEMGRQLMGDPRAMSTSTILTEDSHVQETPAESPSPLSVNRVEQLSQFLETLLALSNSRQLYGEACRLLAGWPGTIAAVVRLTLKAGGARHGSETLACQACDTGKHATFVPQKLHLSRRVLEAVRVSAKPVWASNVGTSPGQIGLTATDDANPRMVFCAPIAEGGDARDVLYLDVPAGLRSPDLFDFVRLAASQVAMVRRSLLWAEAKAEREVIDRQLAMAREVQQRFVDASLRKVEGMDLAACYNPALWVGGDYYDVWRMKDGRLAFAVGDVSGKGLPAAMIMANLQASLRAVTAFCDDPSQTMEEVRSQLVQHLAENIFITLVLGFFDPRSGQLRYVNAGHILPLLFGSSRSVQPLGKPSSPPIGSIEGAFQACVEEIPPHSGLVVVTDGVTEMTSPDGELFGFQRLREVVAAAKAGTANELVTAITDSTTRFRGNQPQPDDFTVLALIRGE